MLREYYESSYSSKCKLCWPSICMMLMPALLPAGLWSGSAALASASGLG
jgi:hypothetical protein